MERVTRDFSAEVEYDGEGFVIILTSLIDRGSFMRPGREAITIPIDEADLPTEIADDLKETYQDRYGDEADDEDDGAEL